MQIDPLGRAYGLSLLTTHCFLPNGFAYPEDIVQAVVLTDAGRDLVGQVMATDASVERASATVAVAGLWSGREGLLVDVEKTDNSRWEGALSLAVASGDVRYPWVFRRELHDKFLKLYGPGIKDINHVQSVELLEGMPQGVAQVGDMVTGPRGIARSESVRLLDPSWLGVAMKCLDRACASVHFVHLSTGETGAGKAYRLAHRAAGATPRDVFTLSRGSVQTAGAFYSPSSNSGLPAFLGNGLTDGELRAVFRSLTSGGSRRVQGFVSDAYGSAKVALRQLETIGAAEVMQVVLLASDVEISQTLDRLVRSDAIRLAPTETRSTIIPPYRSSGMFAPRPELGSAGLRIRSTLNAVDRLHSLIVSSFADHARELEWQLRRSNGGTVHEKLRDYTMERTPRDSIRDLLFSTREVLERCFLVLDRPYWVLPSDEASERDLVERIAWQVGFAPSLPSAVDVPVREAGVRLLAVATSNYSNFEAYASAVRSAGNEFFVQLEEVLHVALAFTAWALLSDHYGRDLRDRFEYSRQAAESLLNLTLSPMVDEGFRWSDSGKNSLGSIIHAWTVLTRALGSREVAVADRRSPIDLPEFAQHSEILPFPFRHRVLWFDLAAGSREMLLSGIADAVSCFTKGEIVAFRNRMTHQTVVDFPDSADCSAAVHSVLAGLDEMENLGLLPSVRSCVERRFDEFGRQWAILADSMGRRTTIINSATLGVVNIPSLKLPQIVLKGALMDGVGQCVRFRVGVDSEWRSYWRDFAEVGPGQDSDGVLISPEPI